MQLAPLQSSTVALTMSALIFGGCAEDVVATDALATEQELADVIKKDLD